MLELPYGAGGEMLPPMGAIGAIGAIGDDPGKAGDPNGRGAIGAPGGGIPTALPVGESGGGTPGADIPMPGGLGACIPPGSIGAGGVAEPYGANGIPGAPGGEGEKGAGGLPTTPDEPRGANGEYGLGAMELKLEEAPNGAKGAIGGLGAAGAPGRSDAPGGGNIEGAPGMPGGAGAPGGARPPIGATTMPGDALRLLAVASISAFTAAAILAFLCLSFQSSLCFLSDQATKLAALASIA